MSGACNASTSFIFRLLTLLCKKTRISPRIDVFLGNLSHSKYQLISDYLLMSTFDCCESRFPNSAKTLVKALVLQKFYLSFAHPINKADESMVSTELATVDGRNLTCF